MRKLIIAIIILSCSCVVNKKNTAIYEHVKNEYSITAEINKSIIESFYDNDTLNKHAFLIK
jgi:hypothetical protein